MSEISDDVIKSLIRKMFEKQNELNIHTNGSDWKTNKDLKWNRAILIECAELIGHTDWKWWKKDDISLKDIEMEVIDIWHFAMSNMMTITTIDNCVENTFYAFKNFETIIFDLETVRYRTEVLIYNCSRDFKFHLDPFVKLCSVLNMNVDSIYKLYMGKNILNKFRQDNGYKEKTYIKMWDDKEDNFYLMKYLDRVIEIGDDFEEELYNFLQETYKKEIYRNLQETYKKNIPN